MRTQKIPDPRPEKIADQDTHWISWLMRHHLIRIHTVFHSAYLLIFYMLVIQVNPLLHRLFLEHCITFNKKFKYFPKKYLLHFNSLENIMENGTFAPQEQMFHFS